MRHDKVTPFKHR